MSARDRLAVAVLLLALALTAKASVEPSLFVWFGAALLVYAAAGLFQRPGAAVVVTPLSAALFGYAGWLVATNLWAHPYTAAASYDAAFLVAGFLTGWRAGRERLAMLFSVALAVTAALAAWSLVQLVFGQASRGHAIFDTPSSLAVTLNLVLAPGLVLVIVGNRNRWLLAGLALLAAGVLGTQSRGGWAALVASLLIAFVLLRRGGARPQRSWMILAGCAALAAALVAAFSWRTAVESGAIRVDLYKAAIDALRDSSWLVGAGYLDFRYVLQAARPSIPGYQLGTTDFVHDDYLQALLESGVPGAALLFLVAVLPLAMAWRRLPAAPGADRPAIVALATAMASMAVQALVDFPFYIALCLVMYGACAGALCALLAAEKAAPHRGRLREVIRATVAGGVLLILVKPVVAEGAAQYARAQWEEGRGERAAYWFDLARRIEPRDWRYHAYAGEFWFVQAQSGTNASAARLADRMFQDGLAANPREVSNLVWRISAHIYLRELLPQPADAATLRAWVERASALAPLDQRVQFHRHLVERFEARAAPR